MSRYFLFCEAKKGRRGISLILVHLWLAFYLISIGVVAQEVSEEDSETSQVKRMAVVIKEFVNKSGAPEELFETLRSRITNDIVNTRKFDVYEREYLDTLVKEVELSQKGVTSSGEDDTTAGFRSAGYIIYGNVLNLGLDRAWGTVGEVQASRQNAKVEIQLRFADLKTGKIIASKEVVGTATQSDITSQGAGTKEGNFERVLIEKAIDRASGKVVEELMELAFPLKVLLVRDGLVCINLPKERAKLEDVYEIFSVGEEIVDPDTGESLGKDEIYIGKVKIVDIKPKISYAEPIGNTKIEAIKKGMIVRPENKEKVQLERIRKEERERNKFEGRF